MTKQVKLNDVIEYVSVRKPFEFLGNMWNAGIAESDFHFTGPASSANVAKATSRGDGEIDSTKGHKTLGELHASLTKVSDRYARLAVTYYVWEDTFESTSKSKADKLYFTASEDIDLGKYYHSLKKDDIQESTTWDFSSKPQPAVYKDYYKNENHKWNTVVLSSYPSANKTQYWIPASSLRFKVDDSGNELKKQGNIGVRGEISFTICVRTKRTQFVEENTDTCGFSQVSSMTRGSNEVISKIDPKVNTVLGRGYDITGDYASPVEVKRSIFDLKLLNQYNRIEVSNNSGIWANHFDGKNSKEVSTSYEKEIGAKASVSLYGVTFKNETKKSYKDENYEKSSCRTVETKVFLRKQMYRIEDYDNLKYLYPFLSANFQRDLAQESPERIIALYGTHVIMGMDMGGRLDYAMSYLQSISKESHAETFSTTSSISYNKTPSGAEKKDGTLEGKAQPASQASKAATAMMNITGGNFEHCEFYNIYVAGSDTKKTGDSKGSSGNSNSSGAEFGAEFEFSYKTSSSKDVNEENESTRIVLSGVGGDESYLMEYINGKTTYCEKWAASLTDSNKWVWCNYPKNTLIPIYKIIPNKAKAQLIKNAWEAYLKDKGSSITPLGETKLTLNTEMAGTRNECIKLRGDWDVSTSSGKLSQFQITFTPVNIDGGKVALAVRYKVSERYMEGGKDTLLQLSKTIEMPSSSYYNYAVSPYVRPYDSKILSYTGKVHGWIDITEQLEDCPYVDTTSGRVLVKIDGSGDDYDNMKIRATFNVPVIYMKKN